ncbi:MAG: hypothetical protein QOJ58_5387 [Alphaproteobacteria bacterium]|jgi:hypothetical protein|nr:hypothetical protein [Alphaproteobacteria bacterium]
MELAKQQVDIGLFTNDLDRMLPFWQNEVGLPFDHVLPLRRGQKQYRHDAAGSVVKINHHIEQIPSAPPSGYRELIVPRTSRSARLNMTNPDGNAVSVVPPGYQGVNRSGIRMGVRDLEAHRHFYANVLGLQEQAYPLGAAFPRRRHRYVVRAKTRYRRRCGHPRSGLALHHLSGLLDG